jgi:hypothetical protein
MVILNSDGSFADLVDESIGLPASRIYSVLQAREGSLWLATANGISRVDLFGPVSIYDAGLGLKRGLVYQVMRYNGELFAASDAGLFRLKPMVCPALHALKQCGNVRQFGALESHQAALALTLRESLASQDGRQRIYLSEESPDLIAADMLLRSTLHPDRFLSAAESGVLAL